MNIRERLAKGFGDALGERAVCGSTDKFHKTGVSRGGGKG
jgi:hypothetical protein